MDDTAAVTHTDQAIAHAEGVIARADELGDRISAETVRLITELVEYKKRAVRWQRLTFVCLIMLFIFGIVGVFAVVKINDNAATIEQICAASNASNVKQAQLWNFILDIPPKPGETDLEKAQKVAFTKVVKDAFAPQDCAAPAVLP